MLADQIRHATDALLPMPGFPGVPSCCYKIHLCTASRMSNVLDVELKERLPMTETDTAPTLPYLATLEQVIADVVAPTAIDIDQTGTFPRVALDALGVAGLLGLISAIEVGRIKRTVRQPRWSNVWRKRVHRPRWLRACIMPAPL
jgi:hypothetical protein